MKKTIITLLALLVLSSSSVFAGGEGSGFGSLTTANTIGMGNGRFMGVVGLADNTSFGGILTYGLSKNSDGRIKLGLIDTGKDSDTKIIFVADFKYNFISTSELQNGPFDMAIGGFFEYFDADGGSLWILGGQYIGSYSIKTKDTSSLTPYGRISVRLESKSNDNPNADSKSNLEVGFNGGVKWGMTNDIDLYGEIQLDGNDGFLFGIDFRIL